MAAVAVCLKSLPNIGSDELDDDDAVEGPTCGNLAEDNTITVQDGIDAHGYVEEKLDGSFFRVRLDRTTELEQAYLRAMAQLGPSARSDPPR